MRHTGNIIGLLARGELSKLTRRTLSLEGIQWRDFFQMADTSRLRGHSLKLKKERPRLDLRKFTFSQRVVRMWNDLPADIVTAPTANTFKKLLEAHFKGPPLVAARVIVATRTVFQHSLAFYAACRERFLSGTCGTCVDWVIRGAFVIDWPPKTGVNDVCVRHCT